MPDEVLEVIDVRKSYGGTSALKGVTITVGRGEFVALVGPSGCGKTTLLKAVAGFEAPTSGSIRLAGADMTDVPPAHRPTSMVFQRLALFPHMTVAQNIGFPLKLRRTAKALLDRRVAEMLELMQLKTEYLSRFPHQLSGGEQQRVALARSMISEPQLLLLDEPLSALDVKLKKALQSELKRLHRQVGMSFLHVTHDLEEAMMLADRIAVMRGGEIQQIGRPDDIYYRPVNMFVAGFIGETNLLPISLVGRSGNCFSFRSAEVESDRPLIPADLVAPAIVDGEAVMMVRPELIRVIDHDTPSPCRMRAYVEEMFIKGSTVQYRARSERGQEVVFEIPGASELPAAVGDHVVLGWKMTDIYVFRQG